MKTVIVGVTGSIAAYKAADIVSELIKEGCNVHVVMTKNATSFITPLTMQALSRNRVYVDTLQEDNPEEIVHVTLPQKADLLLIAPATANIIGKISAGIADDCLTSMVLASYNIPMLIAPAMNTRMYENEVVQNNLRLLQHRGWLQIEPRISRLACGSEGKGALAEVNTIIKTVMEELGV